MSFTDSFLDFEAIKNWFDIIPTSDMAAADTKADVPLLVSDVDDDVPELVGEMVEKTASVSIADDTVKATSAGETESPVDDVIASESREEAGGEIGVADGNDEESGAARDEDESEKPENESAASSSSSSSSSDDEDGDDSDSDEEAEKRDEQASEVEEGEIDAEAEGMVGWSDDEEDVGDEDDKVKGPIRSKNEAKVL